LILACLLSAHSSSLLCIALMRLTCVPAQDVRAIPQTRVLCPKSAARSGVGTPGVAAQAWDASPNVRTSIIILWPPKNPPARFQSHTGFLVWDPTPRILCTVWGGIPHQRFPPKNRPVWDSPTAGVGSSSWVNINSLLLLRFLLLILLLLLLLLLLLVLLLLLLLLFVLLLLLVLLRLLFLFVVASPFDCAVAFALTLLLRLRLLLLWRLRLLLLVLFGICFCFCFCFCFFAFVFCFCICVCFCF